MEEFPPPPEELTHVFVNPYAEANIQGSVRTELPSEDKLDEATKILMQSLDMGLIIKNFCSNCDMIIEENDQSYSAFEKFFHASCFYCKICGQDLSGQTVYLKEKSLFCESDYAETLEKCYTCNSPIKSKILRATGKCYHPQCFTCSVCHKILDGVPFTMDANNYVYCISDFNKKYAPTCSICNDLIIQTEDAENVRIIALDKSFHLNCYKCQDCGISLTREITNSDKIATSMCYPLDGLILCKSCNSCRINQLIQSP